jgi:hypothetical protein
MTEGICDFCGEPNPHWLIPAVDSEIGTIITEERSETHMSEGNWAACNTCVEFVRKGDRKGLEKRCVEVHMEKFPTFERIEMETLIHYVQMSFWRAMIGEPEYHAG